MTKFDTTAPQNNIPRTALVMGGNWDLSSPPEDLALSIESRMRVLALGVLASKGLIDAAVFAAGLTRGSEATPESTAQHGYFIDHFPQLSHLRLIEESLGHTTKMDAKYTARLVEEEDISGPFSLITSRSFLKRQTKVFERQGFTVVPVAAEPLVATLSPAYEAFVRRYNHSGRHLKISTSEAILRGLMRIDPDSMLTERLAARTRPNHS